MPVLRNLAQTNTVKLPSTSELREDEQITVTLFTDVEATKMIQADESVAPNKSARLIALYVADWNVTDDAGEKLAITPENIMRLNYGDFKFLDIYTGDLISKAIEAVSTSLKGLSSPTSQPSTMEKAHQ